MLQEIVAGASFGLSGGLSPGPLLALVLAETVARGRNAGLAVAASPLITDGPIIAASIVLLGRIEDSQPSLGLVNLAGGLLLAAFGFAAMRGPREPLEEVGAHPKIWGSLAKGVAANLLNPSPYLFWLTIGTPLLLQAHASSTARSVIFLAVFYAGLVGSKAVLAVLVARSRTVLRGAAYLWTNRALAVVLLVYALLFLRSGLSRLTGI
jgi:threonine/homoserine/homoserine lactone efflux protein